MEKKGNLLTQLGIIVDLIERLNLESIDQTLTFKLSPIEFERVFNIIQTRYEKKLTMPETDEFVIKIEGITVIFSKSNA